METTVIHPQNHLLRKYINYFLFIQNDDPGYSKKHISYPNTNYCLGMYRGSKLVHTSDYAYSVVTDEGYNSYLTGIYEKPVSFHINGVFDEICIDFEPLGLETLTGLELSSTKFINSIIEDAFPASWQGIYTEAFRSDNLEVRAQSMEAWLLKNMNKDRKHPFIPFNQIITTRVEELKSVYNLSYRSIHRLYHDNLGISPKKFMDISRFRKSITHLKQSEPQSHIVYHNGYSDQSHFIRTFKSHTHLTPTRFLKDVHCIGNEVWLGIR